MEAAMDAGTEPEVKTEPETTETAVAKQSKPTTRRPKAGDYFYALGRRKSATARVRLKAGRGSLVVNDQPAEVYFAGSKSLLEDLVKPFAVVDQVDKFDASVKVNGGGHAGQAEAIRLGLAKALVLVNEDLRGTLKRADLLGRDTREKERKKFGFKGARKKRQFTKR